MKVLMINTVCGYGSTGKICTDIADLLINQGHDCRIAYGRGDVPKKYRQISIRIGNSFDVSIHAGISRITDSVGFHSKRVTREFVNWIDQWKPDLIHLHNLHGYYINIEILFQYIIEKQIPVVWTFHDCWPLTGHCVHYDYIGCDRWIKGCYNCPKKREYPASYFRDASKDNYTRKRNLFTSLQSLTIVTVSDWLKDQVRNSFLQSFTIKRIYNGVDHTIFYPRESDIKKKYGIEEKSVILGVSDSWTERKGIDYFLHLANVLKPDEIIVMIGFTEKKIPKLPEGIIAIRRTNDVEELCQWYSAADVLLNPSYEDTFGLVIVEALSCGTPVIALNATASPELLDDSCGRIIEKRDYLKLREVIDEIGKSTNINTNTCIQHAEVFDKRNYFEYVKLYQSIINHIT